MFSVAYEGILVFHLFFLQGLFLQALCGFDAQINDLIETFWMFLEVAAKVRTKCANQPALFEEELCAQMGSYLQKVQVFDLASITEHAEKSNSSVLLAGHLLTNVFMMTRCLRVVGEGHESHVMSCTFILFM